jgi:hypothetical protein
VKLANEEKIDFYGGTFQRCERFPDLIFYGLDRYAEAVGCLLVSQIV